MAQAATYYVSTSGSDSNSGTSPSDAWKSISKVESMMSTFSSKANSEDVIVYFNNTDTWNLSGTDYFLINATGTSSHWIAFDGSTWGSGNKATLTRSSFADYKPIVRIRPGSASVAHDAYIKLEGFDIDGADLVNYGIVWVENASYVQLNNNIIHGTDLSTYSIGALFTTETASGTIEIHDFTFNNNVVYNTGAHGIAFYPRTGGDLDNVGNITVIGNTIHNFGNNSSSAYGAGIQVMSCYNGMISDNVIYDSNDYDGFGIKLENRARECRNIIVTRNHIYGGSGIRLGTGIANDGGQAITVNNNLIENTVYSGISWGSPDAASGGIYDNTIRNTGSTAISISTSSSVNPYSNNVDGADLTPPSEDTEPPTIPANLSATATSETSINLSWSASSDNIGVSEYRIYRGGSYLDSTTSTSYDDTGLSAGTSYTYTVSALDAAGNESAQSQLAGTTTDAGQPDTVAPTTPANPIATAVSTSQINLSWSASSDNIGVSEYRIYRGGSYLDSTTSTSYADTGLSGSTTYDYTISAKDSAGNESAQSQQASATTLSQTDMISSTQWQNRSIATQSGLCVIECDAIPNAADINSVIGCSLGTASGYTDLAIIARFAPTTGLIDVRNGSAYASDVNVSYTSGVRYHFRFEVDVTTHQYSVYVTEDGGTKQPLALNYAFRSEQSSVTSLDTFATYSSSGSALIMNITASSAAVPKPPPMPEIQSMSY